ncbi:MAG: hypothetical protein MH204_03610 [Fimbriimonadaceae bacterium]|nr:hypothetical protein [Fimbriimonadaceae bacterium]
MTFRFCSSRCDPEPKGAEASEGPEMVSDVIVSMDVSLAEALRASLAKTLAGNAGQEETTVSLPADQTDRAIEIIANNSKMIGQREDGRFRTPGGRRLEYGEHRGMYRIPADFDDPVDPLFEVLESP